MSEEDTSETGLKEAQENFKKFIPLIDTDGLLLMPGTRKHYNDIYQRAMDTGAFKVYVRHGLEDATKDCALDECSKFAQKHPAPDFKTGSPLCVQRMARKDYNDKLMMCEIDPKLGSSYFWHEYMNIPFSPTDRRFQPRWFAKVDDSMIPGKGAPFDPLNRWIALDTAWKDDEHPSGFDYTVIVVGGFDDQGRLYILDILRSREWTMKQGTDALITAMKSYSISRVITEKVGEVTFHTYFKDRCRQAGIPVQLITPKRGGASAKSKFDRIMGLQGYFEQGRVFFRRAVDNFDDCVNEFCNLGRWTNDDIADAISMFVDEQVKVLAPPRAAALPATGSYRPMPFDGPQRRAAFAMTQPRPDVRIDRHSSAYMMQLDEKAIDIDTPELVEMFDKRTDKQDAPQRAFRMLQ
jgi:predicted phage terminase large subunit-like protein